MKIMNKKFSWASFSALLAITLFIFLCSVHFLRGRPLWFDEQSVFKSVVAYQPQDFFSKKLMVGQIFPRVQLFLVQQIARPLDFNVYGVRFFSFFSMLLAFAVWLRVGRLALPDQKQYSLFILCWTASVPLIYYSAELKQYAMDVLASGLFTWFLYRQDSLAKAGLRIRYLLILAALPLLGLFSYPAFLFFIFPIYNLLRPSAGRRDWPAVFIFGTLAAAVIAFVYCFDIRIARASADSQGFADYMVSFQSAGEFFRTWGEGTMNLFSRWFAEQPRIFRKIGVFFVAWGMVYIPAAFFRSIRRKNWRFDQVELLALVLYLELFILGALKKYPFSVPRTSLFFCPIVFLMTIKGMREWLGWNKRVYLAVQIAFVVFLLIIAAGIVRVALTAPLGAIHKIW